MNKLIALPLFAAFTFAATQAQAGRDGYYRYADDDRNDDRYEDRRDRSEPRDYDRRRAPEAEFAEVISAQPIYRSVRIEEPRRECYDERVVYQEQRGGYYNDNGAGTIVGAVIGGVLGHQVGRGHSRRAATAIGAVIGAGVGQQVSRQHAPRPETVQRVGYEEVCNTVVDHRVEQRIESYDVTYRYGGRTYHTSMPYDPGRRIPVDVNVRPVRY